jgi:hypothetical protein
MYRDKTRRKQRTEVRSAATGTDGMTSVVVAMPEQNGDISDVDIQRAGFGVL